jgi:hypothetical protein
MKYISIFKNETISLTRHQSKDDFWLYDETRGMNIAMYAKTEREAFIQALTYYQKRLTKVEKDLKDIETKVEKFVSNFIDDED